MTIENYSCYSFEVKKDIIFLDSVQLKYVFQVFDPQYVPSKETILWESKNWFDTEDEARDVAKGFIDLLETGERLDD